MLTALLAEDPQARPALDALEAALRPIAHPEPAPTVTLPRPAPRPPHPQPRPGPHQRPEPPSPAPPRPPGPGPWWRRRRTAPAAAAGVAAVGAVVAVVLATTATTARSPRDDDGDRTGGGGGGPSPTVTATVEGTYRPPSPPPGVRQEAGGYAWATPEGWRRDVETGAEVHYTSPDGARELVAESSLARGDLMETWRTSEENVHQGRDYRKIRLEETTFRGGPAVVWEYTFTLEGVAWHARLLGPNVDGKSYQVNTWYQPAIEEQALAAYEDVRKSFTVLWERRRAPRRALPRGPVRQEISRS
ncbi:hypothetical protein [Streptomyces sp. NPDC005017]|uniref:hypothetical protein n=1 Tax=Streptomyces sp. NPDC005017 TaxID=3364706 RepID=UPI0036CB8A80